MRSLASISCVLLLWSVGCGDSGGDGGSESGPALTTGDTSAGTTLVDPTAGTVDSADSTTGPPPGPGNDCLLEANDCA